ncbi:MAG: hypothetical protein ACUVSY_11755, partial [Roseiflexus sp.]
RVSLTFFPDDLARINADICTTADAAAVRLERRICIMRICADSTHALRSCTAWLAAICARPARCGRT